MIKIYTALISVVQSILPLSTLFSKKMKDFVAGRKNVFEFIKQTRKASDKIIWIHAASLGEYEQAVPIIKKLKADFPAYKIWLTFFSPSGYEIKKDNHEADYVSYLPLDTRKNAIKFIELLKPELALFIKYEIWPNYIAVLEEQKIPKLLISALFRAEQSYFRKPNGLMASALKKFDFIGVQDKNSLDLLHQIGYSQAIITGDTRYDRVIEQTQRDNQLDFMDAFTKEKGTYIVCGSTWPEDETALSDFIAKAPKEVKFIIAPHEIHASRVAKLQESLPTESILWSELADKNIKDYKILVIDAIGYLGRAYAYADIAYVGGAMGTTGLHNILEPATFGIPVLYGSNTDKHPEAEDLEAAGAGFKIPNKESLSQKLEHLVKEETYRKQIGANAKNFIQSQAGATNKSIEKIAKFLA